MRYFDRYADLIKQKEIPACKKILKTIERVKRYKDTYEFKQNEVDKRIRFIENECSNTKGLRTKLKLALPQKVWLEVAWGFFIDKEITKVDFDTLKEYKAVEKRRLIHQVPIIVPRGTGKTTLGSAIGEVGQIIDGEYGADIQMLAYSREQAGYLYNASRSMTNYEDSILYLLKQKDILKSTKQGMMYTETNSLMSIKTSDYESLDGTNAHYNIFDEVHTYDEDFIKVVNDGSARKRKNWITWYLSTNGTKREKVFDKYYNIWCKLLDNEIQDDSIMPWLYELDSIEEVKKPHLWQKAMPLLGITTDIESIKEDVEMSKNDPVMQAELLAKTFNLPMNSYLAYFTNEECAGYKELFKKELFVGNKQRKARVVVGIDMSDIKDICSVSFMVPEGEKRYFMAKKYMPRITLESLPKEQRDKYEEWEKDGLITFHELEYNNPKWIFNDLKEFISENMLLPVLVAYDPWKAVEIKNYFEDYYGCETLKIPQTVKGLSNGLKIYKQKAKTSQIIFNDNLMTFCHMNVNVKIDHNNNIFPSRKKAKDKIDSFASNLDAFIGYEQIKEELYRYFT